MKPRAYWLLLAAGLFACVWAGLGADRFCMAPFREAQTAISVRYLAADGGGPADYITPVLGFPWAMPMEFGLFQWLAAVIPPGLFGEDNAGRVLSLVCFAGCAAMLRPLARRLGLPAPAAAWVAGLFLLSPVHLGFGVAYLIESLALLLALVHLWSGLVWLQSRSWWSPLTCVASGVLAAVVKGPTWAAAAAALGLLVLLPAGEGEPPAGRRWARLRGAIPVLLALAVSLAAGLAWVAHSDQVKLANPSAAGLVSSRLASWNYGTWEQKLSPSVWARLLAKEGVLLFGPLAVLLPVAAWTARRRLGAGTGAITTAVLVAAFLSAPLVFTNLHHRHQYYLYANGVYLLLAAGFLVASLPEGCWRKLLFLGLPASCLVTSALFIWHHRALRYAMEDRITHVLSGLPAEGAVAFAGPDWIWSPYAPYYAHQKSWFALFSQESLEFDRAVVLNRPVGYQAVVWQGGVDDPAARRLREELLPAATAPEEIWPGIWMVRTKDGPAGPGGAAADDPAMAALKSAKALVPVLRPGLVQHWELRPGALFSADGSVLRCALRGGPDLLYFDSSERVLWRFSRY